MRCEEVIPNPGIGLRLESGDAVGILGTPEQRAAFRALAQKPSRTAQPYEIATLSVERELRQFRLVSENAPSRRTMERTSIRFLDGQSTKFRADITLSRTASPSVRTRATRTSSRVIVFWNV